MSRRPQFVYDGDCGFCKAWVKRWQKKVGDRVAFVSFQSLKESPGRSSEYREGEAVFRGAKGIYRLLAHSRSTLWWSLYRYLPGFALMSELVYKVIASHRRLASKATKPFFKDDESCSV